MPDIALHAPDTIVRSAGSGCGSLDKRSTKANTNQVAPINAKRWARGADVKTAERRAKRAESSRQSHSAHHTEHVTFTIRWHPLHGQTDSRAAQRATVVTSGCASRIEHPAAIPVWMTDRVACAALSIGPVLVSVEALTELASLVTACPHSARSRHPSFRRRNPMRRRRPRQCPSRSTANCRPSCCRRRIAKDLVKALANLLLASAGDANHDEERDDAREDHR